jgi:S-methylmethionine-dependent homocysteine/selenocysteine methylase
MLPRKRGRTACVNDVEPNTPMRYRDQLPQLSDSIFLTDGGIETTLIFHEKLDLPSFAAFHLLNDPAGTSALRKYFRTYAALARKYELGFILESPTWRANPNTVHLTVGYIRIAGTRLLVGPRDLRIG